MIKYNLPADWIKYDFPAIANELVGAKAAVLSLTTMPYQKSWADKLREIQLKREVAGTSRIEGADFTSDELDRAMSESPDEMFSRSQRQAASAVKTYKWIASLPKDYPIDLHLILHIHRLMVTGADDDHCPPGEIRQKGQNVNFGTPKHRGVEGGEEAKEALEGLFTAVNSSFKEHDILVQALAFHYHLAAMHPFLDGNGRTARALEALMLQRAGLRETLFIAMSNFYYEEKANYLKALSMVRQKEFNLEDFLTFGLKGIQFQCRRLGEEINKNVKKALFRDVMLDLFTRLMTKRKRVMAQRQISILNLLLKREYTFEEIQIRTNAEYFALKKPLPALVRDINYLGELGAISVELLPGNKYKIAVRLDWPTEITETEFFDRVKKMPTAKTHGFLPNPF